MELLVSPHGKHRPRHNGGDVGDGGVDCQRHFGAGICPELLHDRRRVHLADGGVAVGDRHPHVHDLVAGGEAVAAAVGNLVLVAVVAHLGRRQADGRLRGLAGSGGGGRGVIGWMHTAVDIEQVRLEVSGKERVVDVDGDGLVLWKVFAAEDADGVAPRPFALASLICRLRRARVQATCWACLATA